MTAQPPTITLRLLTQLKAITGKIAAATTTVITITAATITAITTKGAETRCILSGRIEAQVFYSFNLF